MSKSIAVIVGSLRKDSYNLKIAKVLQQIASSDLSLKIIQIDDLPFYNEDIDGATPPAAYTRFRNEIKAVQGVIFVTPEYNRSVPAVLKNAIDVASRPYGHNVWAKKPALVISSSIGIIGGFGANHHLRQSLTSVDIPTLQQPEVYLSNVASLFDERGNMNDKSKAFLQSVISSYASWVEKQN